MCLFVSEGDNAVGRGKFDLDTLLDERKDVTREAVRLEDNRGNKVGTLLISVKGYQALQAASKGKGSRVR